MRLPVQYTHLGYGFCDVTDDGIIHPGVDLNVGTDDLGEPIFACSRGVVEFVQYSDSGYGNMIVINHGGFYSKYTHLLDIMVEVGDSVNFMSVIGTIGNTGNSSAPHLHWELPIEKQEDWNQYTTGLSVEDVKQKYLDPLEMVKPKKLKVAVVSINSAYARTSDLSKVSNWFFRYTAGQLDFKFDIKKTQEPPKWSKKDKEHIDKTWLKLNILPFASGYDICVLMIDDKDWSPNKADGRAYDTKILGVQVIIMKSERSEKRNNSESIGSDSAPIGRLIHEICHSLYDMSGLKRENFVHYYDYELGHVEQALLPIRYEKIVGWGVPGRFRVFRKRRNDIIDRTLPNSYDFPASGYEKSGFRLDIPIT